MWVLRVFFRAKPTSTHTYCKKAIRESRCRFGRINISPANVTSMKKKIPPNLHLLTLIVLVGSFIKLWPEKKKFQSSVWRVVLLCQFSVLAITTGKKKVTVVCLAGARSLLRLEKKRYSRLSGGCAIIITTGKKRYSCLSGGLCCCVSFWFWREVGSFFVAVGKFSYDRKKKYSHLSGGCAIIIRTGKKSSSCLSGKIQWFIFQVDT